MYILCLWKLLIDNKEKSRIEVNVYLMNHLLAYNFVFFPSRMQLTIDETEILSENFYNYGKCTSYKQYHIVKQYSTHGTY